MMFKFKKAPVTEEELSLLEPRKQYELGAMIQKQLFNFENKIFLLEEYTEFLSSQNMLLKNADKLLFMAAVSGLQVNEISEPLKQEAEKPPLRQVGMEMWQDLASEEEEFEKRFPFITNTPTKDLVEGSSDLRANVKELNAKFSELESSTFADFAALLTTYIESDFTEPFVPVLLPNKCEMTQVMKPGDKEGDPPVVVMETNEEGEEVKKEDTEAFEKCEEEWKQMNLDAIKEGKKIEDDEEAQTIFEEVIKLEQEKAELAALAPPEEQGPETPLNETDKIILAAFEDLKTTLQETAEEWRAKFEEKKDPILKFVEMLDLPPEDDGMDAFMKRGYRGSITGKRNSVTDYKTVKQKENELNNQKSKGKKSSNVKHLKLKHLKQKKSTFLTGINHQKTFDKSDANKLSSMFNKFLRSHGKNRRHQSKNKNSKRAPLQRSKRKMTSDNENANKKIHQNLKNKNRYTRQTRNNKKSVNNSVADLENQVKQLQRRINHTRK